MLFVEDVCEALEVLLSQFVAGFSGGSSAVGLQEVGQFDGVEALA